MSKQAAHSRAAIDYDRGTLSELSALTVGNVSAAIDGRHNTGPADSRVFRGLLDEIERFQQALTLEEIQQMQRAPARRAVGFEPELTVRIEGSELVFEWGATRSFQLLQRRDPDSGMWRTPHGTIDVNGFRYTLRIPFVLTAGQQFYRLSGQ